MTEGNFMDFKTILETLPSIDHLSGLTILDNGTVIHHIPAVAGKLGSLRVYNALAQEFNGKLDRTSAQKGLQLFAEIWPTLLRKNQNRLSYVDMRYKDGFSVRYTSETPSENVSDD